jgi:CRP/FNR family cyclic AMP-dependent transcriptional regulator
MPSLFDYGTGEASETEPDTYFMQQATDGDWGALNQYTHSRRVRAGETVMSPGEVDRALYIVTEGTLEAVVPARRGSFRQLSTFGPGSIIGELSFFDGRPRSATVRALTDAELARLSIEAFDSLAASRPALARMILFDLGRILAARLRGAQLTSTS